jgi:hypothetical protein
MTEGTMMRTVLALLAIFFSSAAGATCYQIFSPANTVVWQGTRPPVAMDDPSIGSAVERIAPGGHLVIVDDVAAPCRSIDLTVKPKPKPARKTGAAKRK